MIRSLAYFPLQSALNSPPVMGAILKSAQQAGIQTHENSMTADAVVIWSVLWAGRMAKNQLVYQHYRAQNKPVIIVEIGALHRGHTWKVSVNHVTAEGYYGHQQDLDPDRASKLGIRLQTAKQSDPSVVIALQHSQSLQVANIGNIENWVINNIAQLRKHTDRPIVIRPHPRCTIKFSILPPDVRLQQPKKLHNTYDSFDFDLGCHAVINYNSGPGIQAALAGVRPLVDASSLAHPVSIDIAAIEQPYLLDRHQWLTEICHTEYTMEELQQGLWLKRIAPALQVP